MPSRLPPLSPGPAWPRVEVDVPGVAFEPGPPPGPVGAAFPDTEVDGWSTGRFTVRAASVRGASHRYYRRPRQDSARVAAHDASGAVVFAVADGVSSARYAERGARLASRAAVTALLRQLDQGGALDLAAVLREAAGRLLALAAAKVRAAGVADLERARLFATTLVAGVVRAEPDGGAVVELCRAGDSGAWILDRDCAAYAPLFAGKAGAGDGADDAVLDNTVVAPLPRLPAQPETAVVRLAPQHVLLVGTDGFGDPLGDGDGRVGRLFAREFAAPPAPLWFAHLLDFSRETFDDDRSLVAVWPDPRAERG
jgi:hypothetical protein